MTRDVALGFDKIPVHKAPYLGALDGILGHQPTFAPQSPAGLVEIFSDYGRADDRMISFGKKRRHRAGRIEREEFLSPRPGSLLDQSNFLAIFAERKPDEAA